MAGFVTWWRKAGGVLAFVVLVAMVFGPTAEAAVCLDNPAAAAAALDEASDTDASAYRADADADTAPCDSGACPCDHCQCHHAGAYAPVALADAQGLYTYRERHALADRPSPTSGLIFGFKRPPRG